MATPIEAVIVTVGDRKIELKPLSNRDRVNLLRALYKAERDQLVATLKESGITEGEEYFATLRDFDTKERVVDNEWVAYCNNPLTDVDIILASLKKTVPDPKEADALADDIAIDFRQKCAICRLTVATQELSPQGSADGINPETGRPFAYQDATAPTSPPDSEAGEPLTTSATKPSTSNIGGPA